MAVYAWHGGDDVRVVYYHLDHPLLLVDISQLVASLHPSVLHSRYYLPSDCMVNS